MVDKEEVQLGNSRHKRIEQLSIIGAELYEGDYLEIDMWNEIKRPKNTYIKFQL